MYSGPGCGYIRSAIMTPDQILLMRQASHLMEMKRAAEAAEVNSRRQAYLMEMNRGAEIDGRSQVLQDNAIKNTSPQECDALSQVTSTKPQVQVNSEEITTKNTAPKLVFLDDEYWDEEDDKEEEEEEEETDEIIEPLSKMPKITIESTADLVSDPFSDVVSITPEEKPILTSKPTSDALSVKLEEKPSTAVCKNGKRKRKRGMRGGKLVIVERKRAIASLGCRLRTDGPSTMKHEDLIKLLKFFYLLSPDDQSLLVEHMKNVELNDPSLYEILKARLRTTPPALHSAEPKLTQDQLDTGNVNTTTPIEIHDSDSDKDKVNPVQMQSEKPILTSKPTSNDLSVKLEEKSSTAVCKGRKRTKRGMRGGKKVNAERVRVFASLRCRLRTAGPSTMQHKELIELLKSFYKLSPDEQSLLVEHMKNVELNDPTSYEILKTHLRTTHPNGPAVAKLTQDQVDAVNVNKTTPIQPQPTSSTVNMNNSTAMEVHNNDTDKNKLNPVQMQSRNDPLEKSVTVSNALSITSEEKPILTSKPFSDAISVELEEKPSTSVCEDDKTNKKRPRGCKGKGGFSKLRYYFRRSGQLIFSNMSNEKLIKFLKNFYKLTYDEQFRINHHMEYVERYNPGLYEILKTHLQTTKPEDITPNRPAVAKLTQDQMDTGNMNKSTPIQSQQSSSTIIMNKSTPIEIHNKDTDEDKLNTVQLQSRNDSLEKTVKVPDALLITPEEKPILTSKPFSDAISVELEEKPSTSVCEDDKTNKKRPRGKGMFSRIRYQLLRVHGQLNFAKMSHDNLIIFLKNFYKLTYDEQFRLDHHLRYVEQYNPRLYEILRTFLQTTEPEYIISNSPAVAKLTQDQMDTGNMNKSTLKQSQQSSSTINMNKSTPIEIHNKDTDEDKLNPVQLQSQNDPFEKSVKVSDVISIIPEEKQVLTSKPFSDAISVELEEKQSTSVCEDDKRNKKRCRGKGMFSRIRYQLLRVHGQLNFAKMSNDNLIIFLKNFYKLSYGEQFRLDHHLRYVERYNPRLYETLRTFLQTTKPEYIPAVAKLTQHQMNTGNMNKSTPKQSQQTSSTINMNKSTPIEIHNNDTDKDKLNTVQMQSRNDPFEKSVKVSDVIPIIPEEKQILNSKPFSDAISVELEEKPFSAFCEDVIIKNSNIRVGRGNKGTFSELRHKLRHFGPLNFETMKHENLIQFLKNFYKLPSNEQFLLIEHMKNVELYNPRLYEILEPHVQTTEPVRMTFNTPAQTYPDQMDNNSTSMQSKESSSTVNMNESTPMEIEDNNDSDKDKLNPVHLDTRYDPFEISEPEEEDEEEDPFKLLDLAVQQVSAYSDPFNPDIEETNNYSNAHNSFDIPSYSQMQSNYIDLTTSDDIPRRTRVINPPIPRRRPVLELPVPNRWFDYSGEASFP